MSKKDDLLKQLKQFIMSPNESAWLTPTQQHSIEKKIDDLDTYINQCYDSRQRKQNARKSKANKDTMGLS